MRDPDDGAATDPGRFLLRGSGLSKAYVTPGGRLEVLREVALTLESAQTVAVVGASGIGKSTLLHLLGTLDRPDAGRLWFRDQDVFELSPARLARFRNASIGFVFQFHHLLPEFTALENVMMPVLIQGRPAAAARAAADAMLARVDLSGRREHRVGHLSGGEQQRVALARALVLHPPLVLADEPTGNLDRGNSREVHDLLLELNREIGMTLVVVTHNMELAAMMARRVTIVDGKLRETR